MDPARIRQKRVEPSMVLGVLFTWSCRLRDVLMWYGGFLFCRDFHLYIS
jgi:hypothetical protein